MKTLSLGKLLAATSLFFTVTAHAQFLPPNAANTEYPYPAAPTPPPVSITTSSSCYSHTAGGWGCGGTLLVNSWEGPGATGFAWQAVDASYNIVDQGYYLYPSSSGIKDLNVGIIYAGGTGIQIDVSYHMAGSGHYLDIWDWQIPSSCGGSGGGATFSSSTQLSCVSNYTKIGMDSYHGEMTAIVWDDPSNGIGVIAGDFNSFGPTFSVASTSGHITPDVALSNTPSGAQIHIASYRSGAGIDEYFVNWADIIPGGVYASTCAGSICSPCSLPATLEDNNAVSVAPNHLRIDAPDINSTRNWAYSYENGNDIFARIMNLNPGAPPAPSYGGTPATVCFTDGSYAALTTINSAVNDVPVISYDWGSGSSPTAIYVGWHTDYIDPMYNPTSAAYIAIQINEDGTLQYPGSPYSFFGASLTPSNISPTPTIAFSKSSNGYSPFLYTTFSESNAGSFWVEHRWVPWNAGQFKTTHTGGSATDEKPAIRISPNPFKDDLKMEFPVETGHDPLMLKITDMAGKTLGSFNCNPQNANTLLSGAGRSLKPGNYIVTVECKTSDFSKAFKVVKVD